MAPSAAWRRDWVPRLVSYQRDVVVITNAWSTRKVAETSPPFVTRCGRPTPHSSFDLGRAAPPLRVTQEEPDRALDDDRTYPGCCCGNARHALVGRSGSR